MKGVNLIEGKVGIAELRKFSISEEEARKYNLYNRLRGKPNFLSVSKGDYVKLYVNGELMMSDTDMEKKTNEDFVRAAKGEILIAGLGIGLLIENLKEKIDKGIITKITIVEKYQDVIDLIAPHYDIPQIHIECADIFERKINKGEKYDAIYFDIWSTICPDNYNEMKELKNKYRRCKRTKNSYVGCWLEKIVKTMYLREKRGDVVW